VYGNRAAGLDTDPSDATARTRRRASPVPCPGKKHRMIAPTIGLLLAREMFKGPAENISKMTGFLATMRHRNQQ